MTAGEMITIGVIGGFVSWAGQLAIDWWRARKRAKMALNVLCVMNGLQRKPRESDAELRARLHGYLSGAGGNARHWGDGDGN